MPSGRRVLRFPSPVSRSDAPRKILFPLDQVFRYSGLAAPTVRRTAPDRIPAAYADLLLNPDGMTMALEERLGGPVGLRTLWARERGRWYLRQVLLVDGRSGRPVAMGAMRVNLDAVPARVRARVLRAAEPFGRVLHEARTDYRSRPRAYFEVTPNSAIMGVFWMKEPRRLYGRQTEMFAGGKKIGDLVEILPPA